MKKIRKSFIFLALTILSTAAFAGNPFNYTKHKNAFLDAKWQLGNPSKDICSKSACESKLNSSSYKKYIYEDRSNMFFSSSGSKSAKWRSELRFLNSFSKGSSKSMVFRVGNYGWGDSSDSNGYTIAQLHMEGANGPPARLEYINSNGMQVTFRNDDGCSSNCWTKKTFNTGASNWKNASIQLSNNWVNVSVNGETKSYQLTSKWPSNGKYYWKAGVYLQKSGTAKVAFNYINW